MLTAVQLRSLQDMRYQSTRPGHQLGHSPGWRGTEVRVDLGLQTLFLLHCLVARSCGYTCYSVEDLYSRKASGNLYGGCIWKPGASARPRISVCY